jgi:hypothetical protein
MSKPVRQEQRMRRLLEESNGKLARALDPLMGEVGVEEVREVPRGDARREAGAVIGQRFVMVANHDADPFRRGEDELEDAQKQFEPEAFVVEQIAEQDDVRGRSAVGLGTPPDQRERGLEREQVAVQVADDPQRR